MSSKTKSITELVMELQSENESLHTVKKQYSRLVSFVCKEEFGLDVKTIHQMLEKQRLYEQRKAEKQGQQSTIPHSEM